MDPHDQERINNVLEFADIHSIKDLTMETVGYLTYELEGRVPITKFHVSPEDYRIWRLEHQEIVDVEYDAWSERIVLKGTATTLHETALEVFRDWLTDWNEELSQDEFHGDYYCDSCSSVDLRGKYSYSEKQADVGLWKAGAQYPRVVVEVGVDEVLREDGRRWFEGTGGETNRVILMNIVEENRPGPVPDDRNWGLTPFQLYTIAHHHLAQRILDWHKTSNVPLVGDRITVDIASLRPGGKVTDAVIKAPIPHLGFQIPRARAMNGSIHVVLSQDESDYHSANNPIGSFPLMRLSEDLTLAISMLLPRERAKKMAWDYVLKREMAE